MAGDGAALIGIDWGTSRQRAYRIDRQGHVLESRSGDRGLSTVRGRDFDAALQALISDWNAENVPVLMCGMVGSRNGWTEAAYCECPFGIEELARTMVPVVSDSGAAYILGGGHVTDMQDHHDVMRGEETQFLGLDDLTGRRLAIAPGTHSKWALLEGGRIRSFRTYMTGELFALLKEHSILGWLMPENEAATHDMAAFADGVRDAAADGDMLHGLFHVRTSGLFHPERAGALSSYLSGLLIGYEVSGAMKLHPAEPITVIAPPRLAQLYELALATMGLRNVRIDDVDAVTARGLWRVWQARKDAS
ncbi:MAG TPA: 2-dehydro-3-deoxygalactonokinase [Rhizomicrobium sp.]|nr:2-dehydro-3-deoxygalactonokinase [Rhizomicrobium sp.]